MRALVPKAAVVTEARVGGSGGWAGIMQGRRVVRVAG
jgi:hypothetical protein